LFTSLLVVGCNAERAPTENIASKSNTPSPPPLQISPILPDDSTSLIQKGERIASLLGCFGCHGRDLYGKPWIEEPELAVLYSSNLTRAVPQYTDAQLDRAIREGVRYDETPLWEMPSDSFLRLSPPDIQALIAYLRSVPPGGDEHPRMVLGPEGEKEVRAGTIAPTTVAVRKARNVVPAFAGAENELGRYLSQVICSECHGPDLRGNPDPETFRPDLIVAASYSLTNFKTLLKTGQPTGNRKLQLMAKVSQSRFSHLTESEVNAIHAYLVARAAAPR
jgi:mono/diheme cytochrome c family protein